MTHVDVQVGAEPKPRLGRKRDLTRDPEILEAALDVLSEIGYERMTVDMVAARAKAGKATVYRRWPSKAELVLDAVACLKNADLDPEHLPDTGSLRGDLLAGIKPHTMQDADRRMRVMAGLMSLMAQEPELGAAARRVIVEPRVAFHRLLLERAIERGEISPGTDVETIAQILPAMVAYRTLVQGALVERDFVLSVIDGVLMPLLGLRSGS